MANDFNVMEPFVERLFTDCTSQKEVVDEYLKYNYILKICIQSINDVATPNNIRLPLKILYITQQFCK